MRLASRLAAFRREEDGGMIELSAVFMTLACIMLGFVIDTGSAYYTKVKLTKIADSAAAGAVLSAPNTTSMINAAVSLAAKNAPPGYGTVTVAADVAAGFYNTSTQAFTSGGQPYNAVKVVAARAVDHSNPLYTYLGKVLGKATSDIHAASYAVRYGGLCLYVLGTSSTAFSTNGNPVLNTTTCPMQVNGSAVVNSNTTIQDSYACVGGTVPSNSGSPTWSTPPQQNCGTLPDPWKSSVQEPTASQCNYTNAPLNGTLSPGLYCYTNAGSVTINGNKTVTGTGVTLYFDASSYLNIGGGAGLNITAPSTGPYAGIAIFQTRTPSASANTFTMQGNGSFSVNGAIYLPASNLSLGGTSGATASFSEMIALTLSLGGSSTYALNAFGANQVNPPGAIAHASLVIPQ